MPRKPVIIEKTIIKITKHVVEVIAQPINQLEYHYDILHYLF